MTKFRLTIGIKMSLIVGSVLGLLYVGLFFNFSFHESKQMNTLMVKQARVLTQQIVLTRQWSAQHGGVYVLKQHGVETNPYLYDVGPGKVMPEIVDRAGNVYTLKNPALITRELSELTAKAGLVRYRLTSLMPVNPVNSPDDFEKAALTRFEKGEKEIALIVKKDGKHFFRYMTPLKVKESCLKCHGFQDYKVGDLRGGISLFLPMDTEMDLVALYRNKMLLEGGMLFLVIILLIIIGNRYFITSPVKQIRTFALHMGSNKSIRPELLARHDELGELAQSMLSSSKKIASYREGLEKKVDKRTRELEEVRKELDELSRTDPLTGLNNRRHMDLEAPKLLALAKRQGNPAAIIMLDIDHFKQFNDIHGHHAGDQALIHTSEILQRLTRPYDLIIRYGGEEFVLVLTGQGAGAGQRSAERIRMEIEQHPVAVSDKEIPVTVSLGVYSAKEISDLDQAIKHADEAMYQAKASGRNRVCVWTA